jgi:hypothetical protein
MNCPEGAELLLLALDEGGPDVREGLVQHLHDCTICQQQVSELQQAAGALRAAVLAPAAADSCLDDIAIAEVIDAVPAVRPAHFAHLANCARCRQQVAAVSQLLRDPSIVNEIAHLEQPIPIRVVHRRLVHAAPVLGLMAAGLAAVLLWPGSNTRTPVVATDSARYRERALTSTVAPRLISPAGNAATANSFVWTSVPRADRYRVTVFDREGSVVWESETSDTTLAMPSAINSARGPLFLWGVKARTGFDRWVDSDTKQFTIRAARSVR